MNRSTRRLGAAVGLLAALALHQGGTGGGAAQARGRVPERIAPRLLTVAMFQSGDPLRGGSGEATVWVQNDHLDQLVPIPGSYSPLYCEARFEHCLVITGVIASNATATMMAVGLSDRLDLSRTHHGRRPRRWAAGQDHDWRCRLGGLGGERRPRHRAGRARDAFGLAVPQGYLGCAQPWCPGGFRAGNEVFQLDPTMTAWAYRLSKNVPLQDDPTSRAYAQHYPQAVARGAPFVAVCTILGVNDFIHGKLMSEWSAWWVSQWTEGKSQYCMSADEEGGIFTALQRLAAAGRVDMRRAMVLRVATDFDTQYPGQTAGASLADALNSTFGFTGLQNVYAVGSAVAREILSKWEQWRSGPPPLP